MQVDMVNRCWKQWTVVAHMGEMHEWFWLENLKESDYLVDIDMVGRTVLRSSEEQDLMVTCFLQILLQQ
jgi:phage terminase large subunit